MIPKNPYYSYNISELPAGCQYCIRGEKLVLFVTGLCPRRCYFCPVSDQKFGKDVTFANERQVEQQEDVLKEAEAMSAKGTGITGGDPLVTVERTAKYIKKLKKKY
ncbi:4Fe-4S cluster-binding domain-containing protein, partial [Candidatus Woesearchaeota archaeon]|nr:4Fe-4S cluster-binding domain-containing protein [Candidatus Woesearchaeota archaeon]